MLSQAMDDAEGSMSVEPEDVPEDVPEAADAVAGQDEAQGEETDHFFQEMDNGEGSMSLEPEDAPEVAEMVWVQDEAQGHEGDPLVHEMDTGQGFMSVEPDIMSVEPEIMSVEPEVTPQFAQPQWAQAVVQDEERAEDPLLEKLTKGQVDQFTAVFDEIDKQREGRIRVKYLGIAVGKVGQAVVPADMVSSLEHVGFPRAQLSNESFISRVEFLRFMAQHGLTAEAKAQKDVQSTKQPREPHKVGRCVHALYSVILFFAHWFGASRFDFNNDGDFDPADVEAFIDQGWGFLRGNFKKRSVPNAKQAAKSGKAAKSAEGPPTASGGAPAVKAMAAPRKVQSLAGIQGRWLVGDPGSDFVANILEGGQCLYDGRYMGPENDLAEGMIDGALAITRPDGWNIDMERSNHHILIFVHPELPALEWRRILGEGEMNLKALEGEWRIFEDGVESTDEVRVESDGWTLYDGQHLHGEDIVIVSVPNGTPVIKRGDGWIADLSRSSTTVVVWVNTLEGVTEVWRRPPHTWQLAVEAAEGSAGDSAMQGVDDVMSLIEDVLQNNVEGEAYEKVQMDAMETMVTKDQFKPHFIILQCLLVLGLWLGFAAKQAAKQGDWYRLATHKAGLDSQFPGWTDLRLVDNSCRSFRLQVWRWLTYQFTHVGANHVGLNCALTLILGFPLEAMVGIFRIALMFNVGVFGGACCYGIWDGVNTVVGMSGGCYSLIGIHFAEILLNWRRMKFRKAKILFLVLLIAIENINTYAGGVSDEKSDRPSSSSSTHFGGFIAGLLIGTMFGHNEVRTRKDTILRVFAVLAGTCLTLFCVIWMMAHEDPLPVWEWAHHEPTLWHQQLYSRRCLGTAWRCVRCACSDKHCLSSLAAVSAVRNSTWFRKDVDQYACPYPWYNFENLPSDKASASVNFASVPIDNPSSPCFTIYA